MPDRPNVLFLCSDQHGYRYTGYAGHPTVRTPNLDRLASEGVVFENAYCASPVCTPSRASMLTGVYPSDVGSYCNSTVWDGSHPTWGSLIRDAGYRTWATGKFDLDPAHDVGFDGTTHSHGHAGSPDITSLFRRPLCYRLAERPGVDGRSRDEDHRDGNLADEAQTFLQAEATGSEDPWAAWVGFSQPHPPFTARTTEYESYLAENIQVPDVDPGEREDQHLIFERLRAFKRLGTPVPTDRKRRARAGYYGMITKLDEYIGHLVDQLRALGEWENTVVIYTSDHGEMLGEHGLWYKNTLYEDAAHVPLVVAGPGIPAGERRTDPVGHVDLIRTILEWADADLPALNRGRSLTSMIADDTGDAPPYVYAESHSEGNCSGSFMIRRGDWKYIHVTWYEDLLFNLAEDPEETENRINDPEVSHVREELRELLFDTVDPTQVTVDAFTAQEETLAELGDKLGAQGLFEELRGRLGDGQAGALVNREFPEWTGQPTSEDYLDSPNNSGKRRSGEG